MPSIFGEMTLRGSRASFVWGYRPAARVASYTVERRREKDEAPWAWTLRATLIGAIDRFALRQRPLLFSADRRGGFFVWPVTRLHVHEHSASNVVVTAELGPPDY